MSPPYELADRAAQAAYEVSGGQPAGEGRHWPTAGEPVLAGSLRADVLTGLYGFVAKHGDAPPEALYRHGVAAYRLCADRAGWEHLDEATRYAYRTFCLVARDLIAEAEATARAAAALRDSGAAPAPANRNLGKRIGKRSGRAGKKAKFTHEKASVEGGPPAGGQQEAEVMSGPSGSGVSRESARASSSQAETLSRQSTDKLRRSKKTNSKKRSRSSKRKSR